MIVLSTSKNAATRPAGAVGAGAPVRGSVGSGTPPL
jgi:hypothetical protein